MVLIEVSHALWSFQPRQVSWWIAVLNMLGSIAFMLAAVFAFFLPSPGAMEWAWGANFFTLAGAVGFFSASYLMIPELFGATGNIETLLLKYYFVSIQHVYEAGTKSLILAISGENFCGRESAVKPAGTYSRRFPEAIAEISDVYGKS